MNEREKQQKRKVLRYKTADFSDSVKTDSAELQGKRFEDKLSSCISPAGGAVVSVWPSPQAARCWGAAVRCSSAEGSHKEARNIQSPVGDTISVSPLPNHNQDGPQAWTHPELYLLSG